MKTLFLVNQSFLESRKTTVQHTIAVLLGIKLVDNKDQARLEMHFQFNQVVAMKKVIVILLVKMIKATPIAPNETLKNQTYLY